MILSAPPPLPAVAALFLDFDGTLAPMAPRPQDVRVPPWVVPTLRSLSTMLDGALAIVSGRPIAQLDAFLAPLALPAAGAHGAEWRRGSGPAEGVRLQPPASIVATAHALARADGLIFEPKPSGFAVHFRARPELEAQCRRTLDEALRSEPGADATWEWLQGHFVHELKQRGVSKGRAVHALSSASPFAGRLPVFVGDDVTDEAGFAEVQAAGGFGVRVGEAATCARFRLADVAAVGRWLQMSAAAIRAGSTNEGEGMSAAQAISNGPPHGGERR